MKHALSARYGGLLVDASECDYTSFKHLHLLCPHCRKSVFLVGSKAIEPHIRKLKGDRTTQVKGSVVDSYFAHHPDVSASAVETCELRVRSMSESEKTAIKTQAKKQLFKTLQRHFWKVLSSSTYLPDPDRQIDAMKRVWVYSSSLNAQAAERQYHLFIESTVAQLKKSMPVCQKEIICIVDDIAAMVKTNQTSIYNFSQNVKPIETLYSNVDKENQINIVMEMLHFLLQPKQKAMLLILMQVCLSQTVEEYAGVLSGCAHNPDNYMSVNEKNKFRSLPSFNNWINRTVATFTVLKSDDYKVLMQNVVSMLLNDLCFIDWAGEYERLHQEELG